jgi:hypothetical protein
MLKNFLLATFAVCGASLIMLAAVADDAADKSDLVKPAAEAPDNALPAQPEAPAERSSGPTPLSVEPGVAPSSISRPSDRPPWVEAPTDRKADVHKFAVSSGPHARRSDCVKALNDDIERVVAEYIDDHLGVGSASKLVHYDLKTIKDRFVADTYEEDVVFSIGEMKQMYAQLKFDKPFRTELDQRWHEIKASSRLLQVGLFGGSVLGFLGLVFGYLKLDTATRGYYTGRLQFGAVAAILGLAAAGVFLARWIPWM